MKTINRRKTLSRILSIGACTLLPAALYSPATSAQSKATVSIAIPADVYRDYQQFIAGRDVETLISFAGPKSRRDVVELALTLRALKIGGLIEPISFEIIDSYERILHEVSSGRVALSGTTVWHDDVARQQDTLLVSQPLLADGEAEAGLFTAADNTKARAASTTGDFSELTAISNPAWSADWKALQQLGLKEIQISRAWNSMRLMVLNKRADLLLAPFPDTPDLSLPLGDSLGGSNLRLVPLPGIKLRLEGSRHLIVSRKHPLGARAIAALGKGLAELKRTGVVRRAYMDCGFFNPRASNWKSPVKPR